jgi:hypothetical protein
MLPSDVPKRLGHIYWIGGGSRAGKSTVARRIAAEQGFQIYETDSSMAEHARCCTEEEHPFLTNFKAMDLDERWVHRSPETMLATFPWFRGECFEMIIADLLKLPSVRPVVVEGFRLLPELVVPIACHSQAVWLLPTRKFRQVVFEKSGGSNWEFLLRTSDPEKALSNLLERDWMFTEQLEDHTRRLGLTSVRVDLEVSEDEVVRRVAKSFGF